jgi:hypothetical protein
MNGSPRNMIIQKSSAFGIGSVVAHGSRELVVHRVRFPEELTLIEQSGITVHRLADVLADLQTTQLLLAGAAGAHLVELIALTAADIVADSDTP